MATTPVQEGTTGNTTGSGSMPVTISMPTGTVATDLVIAVWACDGTGSTVTVEAGDWTTNILRNTASGAANAHASIVTWNTGVTAASTFTATCNDTAEGWGWRTYRISNWNSASNPEISNVNDGNNDDIFDPSGPVTITPSWGSDTVETLFLFISTSDQTNFGVLTWPTELPDNQINGTGTSVVQILSATDDTLQATLNPAEVVGGYSGNTGHTECIVAIRGAAAASGGMMGGLAGQGGLAGTGGLAGIGGGNVG